MSITVRLWTQEELDKAASGDKWLQTLLFNAKTLSAHMIQAMAYCLRRVYVVHFDDAVEGVEVYAADDTNLFKFLRAEYNLDGINVIIRERTTTYRAVFMPVPQFP